jgi:hypothetical protein
MIQIINQLQLDKNGIYKGAKTTSRRPVHFSLNESIGIIRINLIKWPAKITGRFVSGRMRTSFKQRKQIFKICAFHIKIKYNDYVALGRLSSNGQAPKNPIILANSTFFIL